MKRLHITAEGQTEESFVNKTLKYWKERIPIIQRSHERLFQSEK